MTADKIYDEASEVDAVAGIVTMKGPNEINLRLTVRAAEEISERLLQAALKARGQSYFDEENSR